LWGLVAEACESPLPYAAFRERYSVVNTPVLSHASA